MSNSLFFFERIFSIFSLIFIRIYFILGNKEPNIFLLYRVFSFLFFLSKINNFILLFFLYEGSILLVLISVFQTSKSEKKKNALNEIFFWLLLIRSRLLIRIIFLSLKEISNFILILILIPLILKRPIFLRRNWLIILHSQATLLGRIFLAAVILKIPIKFLFYIHLFFYNIKRFNFSFYLIILSIWYLFWRVIIIKQLNHIKIIIAYLRVIHIFPPLILLIFSINFFIIKTSMFLLIAHRLARSAIFLIVTFAKKRFWKLW